MHYGTNSSRERQDHARRPSSHTAIESFERGAEPGTGHQRQDGRQVAEAQDVDDIRTGPKEQRSTVLTLEEESMSVAFRRHTLLPLGDYFYALQPTMGVS